MKLVRQHRKISKILEHLSELLPHVRASIGKEIKFSLSRSKITFRHFQELPRLIV